MSILNPPTQNRRALINFHGGGKNKCNVLNGSIVGIKQPKYVRFGYITTVTEIVKIKALSAKPSEYMERMRACTYKGSYELLLGRVVVCSGCLLSLIVDVFIPGLQNSKIYLKSGKCLVHNT